MNINYEELVNWESTIAALENAQLIFFEAQRIGAGGNYGLAASLMVLSREESQKCLLMAFVTSGFYDISNPDIIEELNECFRWHRYKIASSWLVNAFVSYLIDSSLENLQKNNTPSEVIQSIKESTQIRVENLRRLAMEGTDLLDSIKKAGLYVGPVNGGWSTPARISELIYSQIQSAAATHLRVVRIACGILKRNKFSNDWKLAGQEFRRIISEAPTNPAALSNLEKTGQLGELLAGFLRYLQDNQLIDAYESAHKLPKAKN